ncbi:MAG: cysteine desulfurase family protein [Patescibacteria group bacterium]
MFSTLLKGQRKRIFMDYASTTPVDERVSKAMRDIEPFFANPSAVYKEGVEARRLLNDSREKIATILECKPREVTFTGSGTESCNLAIRGRIDDPANSHIVTTAIEHPAVLESCKALERMGASVTYVGVDERGKVDSQEVLNAIRPETKMVSVMYVNNEIGTVQPIRDIGNGIEKIERERGYPIYFHSDASQAPCYLPIRPEGLKVDALTLDGSKIYGPKGVGILFSRAGFELKPVIYGGGQEFGVRSGTESNVSACAMAEALKIATESMPSERERVGDLKDRLIEDITTSIPHSSVNGDPKEGVAHIVNICVPDSESEFLVLRMDALGVACSSSSACSAKNKGGYSHVLEALGKRECNSSSVRFSLGRYSVESDISGVSQALKKALDL